jgi:hypothetical protein
MIAALRQCLEVLRQVNYADCAESPELWHKHGLAVQEAERVLRDGEKQEPVAWMAFADNGNIRIWAGKNNLGAKEAAEKDGLVLQPVYTHPTPSLPAVVAVPEGYALVPIKPAIEMLDAAWNGGALGGEDDHIECWTLMLAAAPQPAAAHGRASFYLAEDGLTCSHQVSGCNLPVWCKDTPDAYNVLRIIARLYNRASLPLVAPSGDVEREKLLGVLKRIRHEADTGRIAYGVVALNEIIRLADRAITATKEN